MIRRDDMLDEDETTLSGDLAAFSRHLLSVRSWESTNIPKLVPQIALDVFLYSASRAEGASVKEFHYALGHSQDRIRESLNRLNREGLVAIEQSDVDGRIKKVIPTQKLIGLLAEYRSVLFGSVAVERRLRVKKVVRRARADTPQEK